MAGGPLFLGVDVSTTGSKALLVDAAGTVVASATAPHSLQTPRPLWSEQQPHEWWQAACRSIRGALEQADAAGNPGAAAGPPRPGRRLLPPGGGEAPPLPAHPLDAPT